MLLLLFASQVHPLSACSGQAGGNNTKAAACAFEGRIESQSVDAFIARASDAGCKKITLTSLGGEAIDAIRLVDFLNANAITVVLHDHCHSACAQVIAVLADDVIVEPDTLFFTHGISASAVAWLDAHPNAKGYDRVLIKALSEDLLSRISARGGDPLMVYEPALRNEPICVISRPSPRGELIVSSKVTGWMPTREWMELARGSPIGGEWIDTNDHFRRALKANTSGHLDPKAIYGYGGPLIGRDLVIENYDPIAMTARIPLCSAEYEAQFWAAQSRRSPR